MIVLLYKPINNDASERLQKALENAAPEDRIEIYRSIDGLLKGVRKAGYGKGIGVLLVSSEADLEDILSVKEQLRDLRIILILPDRSEKSVSKGHKLYPRFLSYADSDFKDVSSVLKKMLDHSN